MILHSSQRLSPLRGLFEIKKRMRETLFLSGTKVGRSGRKRKGKERNKDKTEGREC